MFPFLFVPLALALGAATHGASATGQPAQPPAADSTVVNDDAPVTIQFDNQAWEMATIYAVPQSGMRVRLGQVQPGGKTRLVVPRGAVGGAGMINIVAVPFARRYAVGSGPVSVMPGDTFNVTLAPNANAVWVLPAR